MAFAPSVVLLWPQNAGRPLRDRHPEQFRIQHDVRAAPAWTTQSNEEAV
jgi:hypothetical protein